MSRGNTLDPMLAPAMAMAERPVMPSRRDMELEAHNLVESLERIGAKASTESDPRAAQQLLNIAEALGVMVISLTAYTRGLVPKVGSRQPGVNLIVPS